MPLWKKYKKFVLPPLRAFEIKDLKIPNRLKGFKDRDEQTKYNLTNRKIYRFLENQTNKCADRKTDRQMCRQKNGQTGKWKKVCNMTEKKYSLIYEDCIYRKTLILKNIFKIKSYILYFIKTFCLELYYWALSRNVNKVTLVTDWLTEWVTKNA